MIIFIIYIKGITTLNLECNSPVPTDLDRPSSFTISLELVETQAEVRRVLAEMRESIC
jgi:hypothetical protein